MLLEAMKKIDYAPPQHFHLYPAPGPLVALPEGEERAVGHHLRGTTALHPTPGAAEFVKIYNERATQGRPARHARRDAGRGLVHRLADPRGRRRRDQEPRRQADRRLAARPRVDTIQGKLRFDGVGNFGDDLMRIKQVQNGDWVVVWPKEVTAGGAKLLAP